LDAAGASRAQAETSAVLKNVRVVDVLERDCLEVDGHANLQTFVNDYLLRTGKNCFLVRDGKGIEGIITPYDLRETDRSRWPYTTVEQAMKRVDQLRAVTPDTPIGDAIEIMKQNEVNELPVVRNGRIEGFITRGGVLRLLQTRAALDM